MIEHVPQHSDLETLASALHRSEQFFQFVAEDGWDAILLVDSRGGIIYANKEAARLFGRPVAELVGQPFGHPLPGKNGQEIQILCRNGDLRVARMRVGRVNIADRTVQLTLLRDVTELARMRQDLSCLSRRDNLTGLLNRRGFTALAQHQLRLARRLRLRPLLLSADVDRLRLVNQCFGQAEGDRLLSDAATVLADTFHEADLLGRIGGDEFVALATEQPPLPRREHVNRLHDAFCAFNRAGERPYTLSLTIGAARFDPDAPAELDELIGSADQALYQARQESPKT